MKMTTGITLLVGIVAGVYLNNFHADRVYASGYTAGTVVKETKGNFQNP